MRILIAEDEKDLNAVICKRLCAEGYAVDSCFDGVECLYYIESVIYDAVVLDISMPKMDGLEVLRRLRSSGKDTPVLLLTAKDSVSDRVRGLDGGANDYLVKPFAFDELLARIRVLLRDKHGGATNTLKLADLYMDTERGTVTRAGRDIELTAREYSLLEYLLRNHDIVLSRSRIENHVWNFDFDGGTNVVDVYIRYLRRKIDDGSRLKLIHTVRGRGYVMKEGDQ